ncbi:helix-turn-helix domain-containing protein [Paenibacillus sp. GCM10027626]|uniref:helix-turn-helix transcriptional regulator n=1 Tax=Paenibacillus sp. GCM10027626 TaxID=3273411 RepID=UPI00362594C3
MNVSFDFLFHVGREGGSHIDDHSHSNYELVYYVDGTGTTKIGAERYHYARRMFTIIQPGCKHDEYRTTDSEVFFICFFYDHERLSLDNGLYEDEDGTVLHILQQMMGELGSKEPYYDLNLHGLLCQLIVAAGRKMKRPAERETSEKVSYAQKYMEQYCTEKIDLFQLARHLGYSYDHFRHFFKEQSGYSPMQYIIRNRIQLAKQLLAQTEQSATEIALECGFSNPPQFSMMFKKDTGLTPVAYRKLHVNDNSLPG